MSAPRVPNFPNCQVLGFKQHIDKIVIHLRAVIQQERMELR